jgi:hypothetical protein
MDRRNCSSEYSKIKKCIPKDYLKFLKNENNDIDNKTKSRRYLFWFPPFVHIVKMLSMLGLIFDKTRDTCLNLRMKHLSIIPKDYLKFLKNENNNIENKTKSRNKMKLLNNLKLTDIRGKIINTKDMNKCWRSS